VQGLGGALFPLAFGIIRDELPAERVGLTFSAMPNVIVESVPADQTGVATG